MVGSVVRLRQPESSARMTTRLILAVVLFEQIVLFAPYERRRDTTHGRGCGQLASLADLEYESSVAAISHLLMGPTVCC